MADEKQNETAEQRSEPTRKERVRARRATERSGRPQRGADERRAERLERRRAKAAARRAWRVKDRKRRADRPAAEAPPAEPRSEGSPKVRQGVVVSDRADKTITVRVDVVRRHRRYQKIMRSSSTLHAHDESNDANAGDTVVVVECRPRSRTKRWRLVEVVERAR